MQFKTIILILFGIFAAVGVAFLALSGRGGTEGEAGAEILIWGMLSEENVSDVVSAMNDADEDRLNVSYVEKSADTYESELVEAIASGNAPDVVFFPDDFLIKHSNKVVPIPFESYPEENFKANFVEAGEIFVKGAEIIALPFSADPLVLFWNRDIFSSEGVAAPPETWAELLALTPRLTITDSNLNITRSTISLGEYDNIDHAKEIIYTLLLQVGNPVISFDGEEYQASLSNISTNASVSALNFYTGFADPNKNTYTWNRSLRSSKEVFLSGDSALYIGFAGEARDLRRRNPNLNFDFVEIPQLENVSKKTVFADLTGLAVLRSSRNQRDAFNTVFELTGRDAVGIWSRIAGEPPVRRDLLSGADAPERQSIINSALWSEGVSEPNGGEAETVIRELINSITSGRQNISDALRESGTSLERVLGDLQ